MAKRAEIPPVRSSAAEYLTFAAASGGDETSVEMRYEDERASLKTVTSGPAARRTERRNRGVLGVTLRFRAPRNAADGPRSRFLEVPENIWLTQKLMATLYDVTVPAVSQHLKRIFSDHELDEEAVVKRYLTTAADGKTYNTKRECREEEQQG